MSASAPPPSPVDPHIHDDPPDPLRLSRRALITLVSGLTVGGIALYGVDGQPVRRVADVGVGPTPTPPAPGQPGAAQPAVGPQLAQPAIYDCASWGARPPKAALKEIQHRPSKIIVHHTATANRTNVAPTDLGVLARSIQKFHMDKEGWADSGHHFLVNRGGLIAEGRHRSLETLRGGRTFIEGSQCLNYNDVSIGIENEGTYTDLDPPTALLISLRALCAFACLRYQVDPANLCGHRDLGDTACPGDRLYALLPALRSQVAQLLGKGKDWQAAVSLTWPLLRSGDRGPAVLAAQHLLRAAGMAGLPADGVFGPSTTVAIEQFQRQHQLPATGMIGGASWPLLAVPARPGQGGEVDAALTALVTAPRQQRVDLPVSVNQQTWQLLLASANPAKP